MHALVKTYADVHGFDLRDLFRVAYMGAFERDIGTSTSLDEDVAEFNRIGRTPPYVIKFFLNIIGVQGEDTPGNVEQPIRQLVTTDPVQALRRAGL